MQLSRPSERQTPDRSGTASLRHIAVVIPCFRVTKHIHNVIDSIGPEVSSIYCVDDGCPDQSWTEIERCAANDMRVILLRHEFNQGVGAAMVTGYRKAVSDGAQIVVKLDGDGQMDASRISALIAPIANGHADYVKGNRFYRIDGLKAMPLPRIIGNAGLSFLTKISSGYWHLFDPTNGFTAIHANVLRALPLGKISQRYFFESDMLFRLGTIRAVVVDVPMKAVYGNETSNLKVSKSVFEFAYRHAVNTRKRIFYSYFLRDFSVATFHFVLGIAFLAFGTCFGLFKWIQVSQVNELASSGTVMLAALPVILGVQLLLNFISFDMANEPRQPIHPSILPDQESGI